MYVPMNPCFLVNYIWRNNVYYNRNMMVKKRSRVAEDKVEISFRLSKELARAIKTKAVQSDRSYSDVVEEGMQEFMAKKK